MNQTVICSFLHLIFQHISQSAYKKHNFILNTLYLIYVMFAGGWLDNKLSESCKRSRNVLFETTNWTSSTSCWFFASHWNIFTTSCCFNPNCDLSLTLTKWSLCLNLTNGFKWCARRLKMLGVLPTFKIGLWCMHSTQF